MTQDQETLNKGNDVFFPTFCWRTITTYMFAYIVAGSIAQIYYSPIWDTGALSAIMRPMNSTWVALGPVLQSINAFAIALIVYPLRSIILGQNNGWSILFLLVAGFSIFTPQAPAPGSFEGLIYTKLSFFEHLIGLPETLIFSFLFSFGLYRWYKKPGMTWNIVSIVSTIVIVLISVLGYLAAIGIIPRS